MSKDYLENLSLNEQNKVIGNAISAYFLIFISSLFLINKNNKYINNPYVKNHTKSALLIHIWFLINYIIFISNKVFSSFSFFNIQLNNIIWSSLFIILLFILIYWVYKAKTKSIFNIWEILKVINPHSKSIQNWEYKFIDINWDNKFDEKDKLTIIISYIPFLWYFNYSKYRENKYIQDWTKFNLLITIIIILLYIFWYYNLANLLSLIYIIFIVFIWINLFTSENLISINLDFIPSPSKKHIILISIIKYLKLYFKDNNLISFKNFIENEKNILIKDETKNEKLLNKLKDIKFPKFLIYIPIINIIFLFFIKSKYKYHIINSLILTILIIIYISISSYNNSKYNLSILFIFPIIYWIWYLKNRLAYKMPLIYDFFEIFSKLFWKTKDINKKYNKTIEINLKTGLKDKKMY